MVGALAAHHGDTSALTAEKLARDAFGDRPWIYLLVAELGGALVGYAALCGLVRLQFGVRGFDMHHLFTKSDFRGRGMGTHLVEGCKLKAYEMSCEYLAVGTQPDNLKAQAFCTALGFKLRMSLSPRFLLKLED